MLVVMKGRRSTHFACVDAYGECRSAQVCDSYKFFVLFAAMFAEDVEFSSKILNEHLARQNYPNVRVTPHKTARNQAVANGDLSAGSTILATPALSTVLTFEEKGQRCDSCFRRPKDGSKLKKCSGCAGYWYCDQTCMFDQLE